MKGVKTVKVIVADEKAYPHCSLMFPIPSRTSFSPGNGLASLRLAAARLSHWRFEHFLGLRHRPKIGTEWREKKLIISVRVLKKNQRTEKRFETKVSSEGVSISYAHAIDSVWWPYDSTLVAVGASDCQCIRCVMRACFHAWNRAKELT